MASEFFFQNIKKKEEQRTWKKQTKHIFLALYLLHPGSSSKHQNSGFVYLLAININLKRAFLFLTSAKSYNIAASSKWPLFSASLATVPMIFVTSNLNFETQPSYEYNVFIIYREMLA